MSTYRLGIDIGGTFTDAACVNEQTGEVQIVKVPSTPADPSGGGSCWIPGSYIPCIGLKHLILKGFFQRCCLGRAPRGKPVKTTCYAKIDQLRPWNPI